MRFKSADVIIIHFLLFYKANFERWQADVRSNPFTAHPPPDGLGDSTTFTCTFVGSSGVAEVWNSAEGTNMDEFAAPTLAEFQKDLSYVWQTATLKSANTFCYRRLRMCDMNYDFHKLLNAS